MTEQLLDMSVVRIDGDTQPRAAINPGIVQEYAEALEGGTEFPAVPVVHDGATYWLVDGFHRFFAHRRLNRPQIRAEVIAGELTDARWLSVAANKAHGLRRTNEDKVKAVVRALELRPDVSNAAIAEHVGVSEEMVRQRRMQLDGVARSQPLGPATRVGRDGKRYPARSAKRRRARFTIAKDAFRPVRTGTPPAPLTALNMPHDPVMGARTLIEVFDADYLRALVTFLIETFDVGHLQTLHASVTKRLEVVQGAAR